MIRLRTLAILATAVMGMALLACGDDEPPAAPASVSEPPATATVMPAVTATEAAPADTPVPTATAIAAAPEATATATPEPTTTPVPMTTATATPAPTATATPRPTFTPTPRPTVTPRPTATPRPAPTPTPEPTPTPTPRPPVGPGTEQRNIQLPLSGEMQLTIQRSKPGAARSMDLLEHSVRTIEEFMGEPFPVRYVGILFKDAVHAAEGSAGTNFGNVIAQRARYDVDDGSRDAQTLPGLTSHEIAHYYWRGNEDWIDEGAATFMEFIVENARTGASLVADQRPCAYYDNLGELDRANPALPDSGYWAEFGCNYSLGERLFLDLYRTLGRDQFQQGFRNLYTAIKGRSAYGGIAEVEEAFKKDAAPEAVADVDTVINRWYHGTEPYDLSHWDDSPVDPILPSIKGRIEDAFISLDQEWPVSLSSRTDRLTVSELDELDGWAYLYLDFGLSITANDRSIPLTYVEYYEDGVPFRSRVVTHTFEGSWTWGWWRVSIGYSPTQQWATGKYGVMVYDGERKVAQVEYEVAP